MQTIKMSFLVVPCSAHYNIRANNLIVVELSLRSNIMVRTKFSRMRTFVLHTFIGNKNIHIKSSESRISDISIDPTLNDSLTKSTCR